MRHANPTFTFSGVEIKDLVKAWILTSIAFAIFFIRGGYLSVDEITAIGFSMVVLLAGATAGVGFIVHELCHKIAAHHYGAYGEFRAHTGMLFMSIIFAFFGFLFAAPGAVYISGHITRKENGIISAAGPVSNMALTLLFIPLLAFPGLLGVIGAFGVLINAILGAFNLIPFLGLDGSKVLAWSKAAYFSLVVIAGALMVLAYSIV